MDSVILASFFLVIIILLAIVYWLVGIIKGIKTNVSRLINVTRTHQVGLQIIRQDVKRLREELARWIY